MDSLHQAHLILLTLWGGVVLLEVALELRPADEAARRLTARLHSWIDLALEFPLLLGVLVTGGLLGARAWPFSPLLWTKIACGLLAMGLNGWCMVHVILRHRRADNPAAFRHHHRRVLLSGVGVPPALAAAYLGLTHFTG